MRGPLDTMTLTTGAIGLVAPLAIVAVTGMLVLLADLIWIRDDVTTRDARPWLAYLGIAGLALAAIATLASAGAQGTLAAGTLIFDPLTTTFSLLFLGIGILVLLVSIDALPRFTSWPGEYYTLVIWCTLGSMLVASAGELFTLFICLQLTSLPLIVLIGFGKHDPHTREAALKYLLMVLVSTTLFLYGISLVYGAFGTSSISEIAAALAQGPLPILGTAGFAFMLAGFGFKTAAAPFQQWVPDVYEGAPTPVTAFLAVGSKLVGFALVMRLVMTALASQPNAHYAFVILAVVSMIVGNLGAMQQTNIKRLLAYSGIAQAGYILVGFSALSETGTSSVLFYLAAYAIANLLAFAVVIGISHETGSEHIADYAGLVHRSPLAASGLTVALLSLAGLPLTVGFMAKFYVFFSAAEAGMLWLVVVAVANTVAAFYYYLRTVWSLYVPETDAEPFVLPPRLAATTIVCTIGVIALGVLPGPLLGATARVAEALFGL